MVTQMKQNQSFLHCWSPHLIAEVTLVMHISTTLWSLSLRVYSGRLAISRILLTTSVRSFTMTWSGTLNKSPAWGKNYSIRFLAIQTSCTKYMAVGKDNEYNTVTPQNYQVYEWQNRKWAENQERWTLLNVNGVCFRPVSYYFMFWGMIYFLGWLHGQGDDSHLSASSTEEYKSHKV